MSHGFLTKDDLRQLTGAARQGDQVEWLRRIYVSYYPVAWLAGEEPPCWPIAKLTVKDGDVSASLYAPGLPDGQFDVWLEPDASGVAMPLAPADDPRVSALRWLLNITHEFDRKDVRTRQAARLLDEFTGGDGRTNRELLEDLWREVTANGGVKGPEHG